MNVSQRTRGETGRAYALRVLKANITDLSLAPGSMLSESELAERLGLSRTPVREALQDLVHVGIVEVYPQKGSRVALIDDAMVDEARFLRFQLETGVVRQLCGCPKETLAPLEEAVRLQRFYLENGTSQQSLEQDDDFHRLLFAAAGKTHCYDLMQSMGIHFNRVRRLTQSREKDRRNIGEHAELLEAILAGQPDRAEAVMERHLSHYRGDETAIRAEHPEYFK